MVRSQAGRLVTFLQIGQILGSVASVDNLHKNYDDTVEYRISACHPYTEYTVGTPSTPTSSRWPW